MTPEEKARAYDKALEKARMYRDNAKAVEDYSAVARYENIFPQLRESEDERMRKLIIDRVRSATEMTEGLRELLLSYLEKQKYDRMKPIYDARESFESALEKAWNDYHNGYENVDKLEDDYVECAHAKGFREGYLFGIEKQKEQKPANHNLTTWHRDVVYSAMCDKNLDEGLRCNLEVVYKTIKELVDRTPVVKEQKPAEWNKATINGEPIPTENQSVDISCRVWSEEDEHRRQQAINALDRNGYYVLVDWLKSLRPSWKPSKEEMEGLKRI